MICEKCGSSEVWPDHDRVNGVEVYACWVCGWRYYPAYPARTPAKADDYHIPEKKKLVCQLPSCGKSFEGRAGTKYCCRQCGETARRELSRNWNRDFNQSARNQAQGQAI